MFVQGVAAGAGAWEHVGVAAKRPAQTLKLDALSQVGHNSMFGDS